MNKTLRVCLLVGLSILGPIFFPAAILAGVGVSPSSISFGSVSVNTVSSAATIVITNTSNQSILISSVTSSLPEFVVSGISSPVSVAARSSTTVVVYFRPDAVTQFNGSIVVTGARHHQVSATISVSGTGVPVASSSTATSAISFNTGSLALGNVLIGTSGSLPFTITNSGATTISVSQVAVSGAGFSVSGFSGGASLSAGQTLSLTAAFSPTTSGPATGAISIVSNASNSPSTISLSGTGVQPLISATPSSLSFGSVLVGNSQSQNVTVRNPGTADLSVTQATISGTGFTLSGMTLPLTIAPSGSASFSVRFAPASAGSFTGSLSLTNNANSAPVIVALSGTGNLQTSLLTASPTSLSFGNQPIGTNATQTATISNTGTSSVSVSAITVTGSGFTVAAPTLPLTLAAGQSISFGATFAPTTSGSVSGAVTVSSNATNSPVTLSLSGTGVQPQITIVPASVSFGNVPVASTNSQAITIQNHGTATLSISQATVSGTGFSLSGLILPASLAPGGSASFSLAFTPASTSTYSGMLTLVSNAPTSPTNIPLSGAGISQVLQLSASPTSLSFGSLNTGTSSVGSVTITNTGNATVSISQVTASGSGFTTAAISLPLSLAAGQSTSISVIFGPTVTGSLSGGLTVSSNAINSPLVIALSGSGSSPASHSVSLSWTSSSPTYQGFNVYRSAVSGGPYSKINSSLILAPSLTDISVSGGQTYYYVATEVDSMGAESAYSAEANAVLP